jgi:hypothetical protein
MPTAEQHRISRAMTFQESVVAIPAVSGSVIAASANRKAIILTPPVAGNYTISTTATAVLGQGISIAAGQAPVIIDEENYGIAARSAWNGIGSAAFNANIFLITTTADQ